MLYGYFIACKGNCKNVASKVLLGSECSPIVLCLPPYTFFSSPQWPWELLEISLPGSIYVPAPPQALSIFDLWATQDVDGSLMDAGLSRHCFSAASFCFERSNLLTSLLWVYTFSDMWTAAYVAPQTRTYCATYPPLTLPGDKNFLKQVSGFQKFEHVFIQMSQRRKSWVKSALFVLDFSVLTMVFSILLWHEKKV